MDTKTIPVTEQPQKTEKKKSRSQGAETWRRLSKNIPSMISLAFIVLLILSAIFAEQIAPYNYATQDLTNTFAMPSAEHLMGTDNFGRDLFSRILYGGRISLLVSFISVIISVVAALFLGSLVGYYGGMFDDVVMRFLDIFMAIPGMLLAITIAAALGPGLVNTAIAISVGGIPAFVRQLRSSVLLLRNQEYIEAAKAFGASDAKVITKHIIPNTMAPLIVQISLRFAGSITAISGLSFIGLGVQPPTPEWGQILSTGREYIRTFWPMMTFPGILIGLSMLAFSLLGDGLRDAMDPRLRS